MHHNLFNILMFTLVGVIATATDWIGMVIEADASYISSVIVGFFMIAQYLVYRKQYDMANHITQRLPVLGMIGTVVGFIMISFSVLGDLSDVEQIITLLLAGLGVAFYTTLVGMVGAAWLGTLIFLKLRVEND